jgi:hypothetical protein
MAGKHGNRKYCRNELCTTKMLILKNFFYFTENCGFPSEKNGHIETAQTSRVCCKK